MSCVARVNEDGSILVYDSAIDKEYIISVDENPVSFLSKTGWVKVGDAWTRPSASTLYKMSKHPVAVTGSASLQMLEPEPICRIKDGDFIFVETAELVDFVYHPIGFKLYLAEDFHKSRRPLFNDLSFPIEIDYIGFYADRKAAINEAVSVVISMSDNGLINLEAI